MPRTFWILGALLLLTSCTSLPIESALDRVQPGMDKPQVLEAAGNPKRTYREQGRDHWVYIYFKDNREMSREVIFDSGKVEKVTSGRAKTNWEAELEKVHSPSTDADFKSIDGGKD